MHQMYKMRQLLKKLVNLGASNSVIVASQVKNRHPGTVSYRFASRLVNPCLYLDVKVFGKLLRALLDSCASRTIIGKNGLLFLEKFPTRANTVHNHYVETADGQRHLISGVVYLPISLEGKTKDLQVLVVPNLEQTLILGVDFWDGMHNRRSPSYLGIL